jgi:hypothetical protein
MVRTALKFVAVACVSGALLAGGCAGRKRDDGAAQKPATPAQKGAAVPESFSVLAKGQPAPAGRPGQAVPGDSLLADLASGDMVKAWAAEERLMARGPSAAPAARSLFSSGSPEARAAGCRLAFHFKDAAAIPAMIELLGDESRLVRTEAGVCLCGMTGQDFGFRTDAMGADRAAAQARWREWCSRTYGTPLPGARR